jgi:hypothetical protein
MEILMKTKERESQGMHPPHTRQEMTLHVISLARLVTVSLSIQATRFEDTIIQSSSDKDVFNQ